MQFLHNQGQITLCIFTFLCYLPVITNFSKTKMLCWLQKSHSFFENMYRFQDIWRIGNSRFWREKRDFPFFVSFSFIQSMSRCKEVYSQNHNSITFLSRHWNLKVVELNVKKSYKENLRETCNFFIIKGR